MSQQGMTYEELKKSREYNVYVSPLEDYGVKLVEVVARTDGFRSVPLALKVLEVLSLILGIMVDTDSVVF